MTESFSDVISKMKYHLKAREEGFSFPLTPQYNKVVGNILPAQYTVVTGMPSSGKTSFVDQNYVLNILLQHEKMDPKPPLKIFYFSLKDTSLKKFQSLLCTYIKLVHNLRVDIPTLNSQPGRIYNIENEPTILAAIDDAELFFNEILEDQLLEIITNISQPSGINSFIREYLSLHADDVEKPFVVVVVDSTDHLAIESDNYHTIQGNELDHRFNSYISTLVKEEGVHAVIITPAHGANSRFPKENEPNYRQLGLYGKNCDKGVVLYNPIAENNTNYLRVVQDPEAYISTDGLNTLRFWHIVKNSDGIESVSDRLLFLPGTSYMVEIRMHETVDSFNTVKSLLFNVGLNSFYRRPQEYEITPIEEHSSDAVPTADGESEPEE